MSYYRNFGSFLNVMGLLALLVLFSSGLFRWMKTRTMLVPTISPFWVRKPLLIGDAGPIGPGESPVKVEESELGDDVIYENKAGRG